MKLRHTSSLLALHFSLMLVACGPVLTPVNQPTGTPTAVASPSDTPTATPTPSPTPAGTTPSGTPTTPAPTGNPASGTSTTVTLPNGSKLVISLGNRYLDAMGQTIQLQASLVDAAGQPLPLNTLKLLYSSSRPQDISVNDQGLITALVDQGFADITVIVEGTEIKASQLVSVNSLETFSGGGGGGGTPQPSPTPLEDLTVDVEFEGLGVGEFLVNTYTSQGQRYSSIAMDADGDFAVVWQSYGQDISSTYGVFAQRYTSDGSELGSEFRVNTYTASNQDIAAIAMDDDGDFVIAWNGYGRDGNANGVYARRYNSAGTAQGSEFKVNSNTFMSQRNPSIGMDSDGDFVISWESQSQDGSGYGIYAQRYTSLGAEQGSEFRINTHTTGAQVFSKLAMDNDGDFVVTWQSAGQDGDNYGIYARRYNSAGTAQTASEFRVNTYVASVQSEVAVAMDNDGDFVVTWQSYYQDVSGWGVYARRYDSAGTALDTSEFRVNTYTSNHQAYSAIAMDADGDFVVTWASDGQDGSKYGVYAQRYTSAGTTQGSEFRLNGYTSQYQQLPSIAMDDSGNFVINWTSTQDGSGEGVYALRFNAAGEAQ